MLKRTENAFAAARERHYAFLVDSLESESIELLQLAAAMRDSTCEILDEINYAS